MADLLSDDPLRDFLRRFGSKEFAYGSGAADCAQFVQAWIDRVKAVRPGEEIGPYTGSAEAARIVRRAGGMRRLAARLAKAGDLTPTDDPRPGDVGLVRVGRRLTFAICVLPGKWAVKTRRGVAVSAIEMVDAWTMRREGGLAAGPETVGAFLLSIVGVGNATLITVGTSTLTLANVVGTVALTAASIGLQLALARRPNMDPGSQQVTMRQSIGARIIHYGTVKCAGTLVFNRTAGDYWYRLIVTGHGRDDALLEHWLGSKQVEVSPTAPFATTTEPHYQFATIETRDGRDDPAPYQRLIDAFPGEWTTSHLLKGLSTALVVFENPGAKKFGKFFPSGRVDYRQVKRGRRIFDPREPAHDPEDATTWEWSDNPSLIALDYLRHPDIYGARFPLADIDLPAFADFADLCDEPVGLKAGGTERRYRCCGSVPLTNEKKNGLRAILATCDGRLRRSPSGKLGIAGGKFLTPGFTLTERDIITTDAEFVRDKTERANQVSPLFTSPFHDFQKIEAAPWRMEADIAANGLDDRPLDLEFVPSHTQAQRLGSIYGHRLNGMTASHTCNFGAKQAFEQPTISVDSAAYAGTMMVDGMTNTYTATSAGVSLKLTEDKSEFYAWNPATDEGPAPTITVDSDATQAPAVTSFVAYVERVEVTAGVFVSKIHVDVTPPGFGSWISIGRYRATGATEWINLSAVSDHVLTSDVVADDEYEVSVAHAGSGGFDSRYIGTWATPQVLDVVADSTPPGTITGLAITPASGAAPKNVVLTWSNSGSANARGARVYRGASSTFSSATLIATVYGAPSAAMTHTDPSVAAGTYWWFVASINGSGIAGTEVSDTATI